MPDVPLGREGRNPSEVPILGASAMELSPSVILVSTLAKGGNAVTERAQLVTKAGKAELVIMARMRAISRELRAIIRLRNITRSI